ncbi:hypothetical protein ABZ769_14755 [Streptomyces olivoreticuli]
MDAMVIALMAAMAVLIIRKPRDPHIWYLWGISLVLVVGWWMFHEVFTPGVTEVTL